MKIPTLIEIEKSIGGRTKSNNRKARLTFYLTPSEARLLKEYASNNDQSISEIVRRLLKELINN